MTDARFRSPSTKAIQSGSPAGHHLEAEASAPETDNRDRLTRTLPRGAPWSSSAFQIHSVSLLGRHLDARGNGSKRLNTFKLNLETGELAPHS